MTTRDTEVEVKSARRNMECDYCPEGVMVHIPNSPVLMSYPPKYSHECDVCGKTKAFRETYPHIVQIVVDKATGKVID